MHTLQHQMSRVDIGAFLLSWTAPRKKDDAWSHTIHRLDCLACQALPSLIRVRKGLVCAHRQASVEE